ncbi:MAG: hypothetical protein K9N51_12785, partial [Candidatus Pacebacteria bacterium]|nr:hypothetical protein [Candidatus Paceibacterota bacterium]
YGNRLLAGGHVAAGLSEETLQRVSAAISDLMAEGSVSNIQTSADELGIPVDKLLRVMILDRLHREFGCRADDDSGRR